MEKNEVKIELKEIHNILLEIGIPTHVAGFTYLTSAIELVLANPEEMNKYTGLYADIAHRHKSTIAKVERAIRNAIERAWNNGNVDFLDDLFKCSVLPSKGAPSNRQFISRMYFYRITK